VCNHQSTLDDPMFQAALLPADVRWSAKRMRWGVCTEEICFSSPAIASFMGMGKALPIQRGGSIHQKAMATLQAKVNAGDWVHVFPEARVWQENGTPQRDAGGRWCSAGGRCGPAWQKVGPMKWGVGKIVANAAAPPVIVPYYHQGMCYVRPQRSDNEYQTDWPIFNVRKKLTVKVRGTGRARRRSAAAPARWA
jgi:monolysocardiolipin acyltransferase